VQVVTSACISLQHTNRNSPK